MFLNCLTCFGRHTAQHQELKNCNCSLWFYIRFWLPVAARLQLQFLSSWWWAVETCWAIKKQWNNKFYYTVASCWFFLWDLRLRYFQKAENAFIKYMLIIRLLHHVPKKMVNFCYQEYKGKCVRHEHTADINHRPSENSFTSRPKQTGLLQIW
jgi:hypothetical protein